MVYPEKKENCPNCYLDTMGTRTRSVSLYRPGGPASFERGMPCPLCDGKGYKIIETTEEISLRIYWERKSWVDVGIPLDFPQGSIQTIANMEDLPKIDKAKYLMPTEYGNLASHHTMKFTKSGASFPQGFKQNPTKYAVTFWERN